MKQIITKDEVSKAIQNLTKNGKKPTLGAIYEALSRRGSMSTIVRIKAEIEATAQSKADSPEALTAFRDIWSMAVDAGRKQQEAVHAELRDSIQSLATENERLDAVALAGQTRATELEQEKLRVEAELRELRMQTDTELKQARTALAEAAKREAMALEKLAKAQESHAAQVKTLQSGLTSAVHKSHDLELQLVRATALLEAKDKGPRI